MYICISKRANYPALVNNSEHALQSVYKHVRVRARARVYVFIYVNICVRVCIPIHDVVLVQI